VAKTQVPCTPYHPPRIAGVNKQIKSNLHSKILVSIVGAMARPNTACCAR
jgi:hypothetical protein